MSLMSHAEKELNLFKMTENPNEKEFDANKVMRKNILEIVEVFSKQKHSDCSAGYAIALIEKLLKFEPLAPITGDEDEWVDVSDKSSGEQYQNRRCSALFKDGKDATPYYIDAIVFKDEEGFTFTSNCVRCEKESTDFFSPLGSKQKVRLPFTPKTFYVDVKIMHKDTLDERTIIKDTSQLDEVFKYYLKS